MLTELSLHVLLAVGEGAVHGYAIGRDIEQRSGGRLDPTTGALYQALKRLTRDGLVRQVRPPKGADVDARRRYFALTAEGRRAVSAEIRRLDGLVELAQQRRLYTARAR
jgi:DNA-binding PadR family transcriptional regulator